MKTPLKTSNNITLLSSYNNSQKSQSEKGLARVPSRVDLSEIDIDPESFDLSTTWASGATKICCVNAYPNGITFSLHKGPVTFDKQGSLQQVEEGEHFSDQFHLRFKETRDYKMPEGKYFLYRDNFVPPLEKQLARLHTDGILDSTVVYFGTTSDPFFAFQKKFDVCMSCLELFEQYRPGLLVVQTRSPMVISALPLLKRMGDRVVTAVSVETSSEAAVCRYTPGQPRIAERLVAASGLRRQGLRVNLVCSPILPYGDFHRDAWNFAELLDNHADFVTFGALASGKQQDESKLKSLPLAQKLAFDKQYQWLRPYSFRNIYYALSELAPEKLVLPVNMPLKTTQLSMFAA